jgi:effector-binding domain-containing protein
MTNVQNESILDPTPGSPNGYVTKDMEWAAVPCGKKFIIIHKGQQVHVSNNYKSAVSYIEKEVKALKKKTKGPLDQFL